MTQNGLSVSWRFVTSPFSGKRILITGGAGFLGRGIIRYLLDNRISADITVYSRDEHKHHALRARYPWVATALGDVRDVERLTAVATGHDIIIHAAAMKHIPESERDVSEAVKTNVLGSQAVIQAAMSARTVKQVVAISTDKAASPRNAYGMTKSLMERLFQEAQRTCPSVRWTCVRYGNVISSTGSVVPLFREQLKASGRVTLTSLEMTRFWISVNDAVRLVEKALSDDGRRGHTYVAKCPAMRIPDVARAVRTGGSPEGDLDIPFQIVGVRAGEKLHESLIDTYEGEYTLDDGDYFVIPPALAMVGEGYGKSEGYTSDRPDRWMTSDEFAKLIADAETV